MLHFNCKNNDSWTFLIFFVFSIVFPLELEACLLLLWLILHPHKWAVGGHNLWNPLTFLICETSLSATPHLQASLWTHCIRKSISYSPLIKTTKKAKENKTKKEHISLLYWGRCICQNQRWDLCPKSYKYI